MEPFNKYITGSAAGVAQAETDRLVSRYEWFTSARRARALLYGQADPRLALPLMFSPTVPPSGNREARGGVTAPEDHIIDRFLEHGGYRIVPGDDTGNDVPLNDTFDTDGDDLLTEELAEIYRSQGLYAESKEIYRRLSLLNPEKSIYFADVIAQIDREITNN